MKWNNTRPMSNRVSLSRRKVRTKRSRFPFGLKYRHWFSLLITLSFITVTVGSASAALEVEFTQEATTLSIGEVGLWEATITNPDPGDVVNGELVVTLPDDFTLTDAGGGTEVLVPHTLTWTGLTITGNNGTNIQTFEARPQCNATNLQQMDAVVNPGGVAASSGSITIGNPLVTVSLLDGADSSSTDAFLGDTITWYLTISNNGDGDVAQGADIAFTLGEHLNFVSISSSTGHATPPSLTPAVEEIWNSGSIAIGAQAIYEIEATVVQCDPVKLVNDVYVNWTDGDSDCLTQDIFANASVALEIRAPLLAITYTPPAPFDYCSTGQGQIEVDNNAGVGPAVTPEIEVIGLPGGWEISNPSSGVTWDAPSSTFTTPDVPAGDTLVFTFDIGTTDGSCPAATSTNLILSPTYYDECYPLGTTFFPPLIGPEVFSIDGSTIPSITVEKTGPSSAGLSETNLQYTLSVTYNAPSGSIVMDIEDDYPDSAQTGLTDGFVVTDAAGGTDASGVLTWSNVTLIAGVPWVQTITMTAPTDECAQGNQYVNTLSTIGTFTDCRGCAIATPSASQSIHINQGDFPLLIDSSTKSVSYQDAAGGQVCRDVYYTSCYTFANDPMGPGVWDNIVFTEDMANNQTYVSVDSVTVNGNPVPNSCYSITSTAGPLTIDMSALDDGGLCTSPAPNTGAALCVNYTLHAEETSVGGFLDWSALTLDTGFGSGCASDPAYYQAVSVSITRSQLTFDTVSPIIIESCEITQHRINISGSWIGYDSELMIDLAGHYDLYLGDPLYPVEFHNMEYENGTPVPSSDPTDNGNDTYSWDFGDIKPQGYITLYMQHICDQDGSWSLQGDYNDLCFNDVGTTNFVSTDTEQPFVIKRGELFLYQVPEEFTAFTRRPKVTLYVVNGGNGAAHNVDLQIDFDTDLTYWSSSIPAGSDVPVITGNPGDAQVVYHYDTIAPGKVNKIDLTADLIGCTDLDIDSTLTWGCGTTICDTLIETSRVNLPSSAMVVFKHTADNVDYCGAESLISLEASNNGLTDVYNVRLVELLPPGLTYVATDSIVYANGYGALTGSPTVSTQLVGSPAREEITWNFDTVLPLNTDNDPAMKPGSTLSVDLRVSITDCTAASLYSGNDKKASSTASFDMPCDFGGWISVNFITKTCDE